MIVELQYPHSTQLYPVRSVRVADDGQTLHWEESTGLTDSCELAGVTVDVLEGGHRYRLNTAEAPAATEPAGGHVAGGITWDTSDDGATVVKDAEGNVLARLGLLGDPRSKVYTAPAGTGHKTMWTVYADGTTVVKNAAGDTLFRLGNLTP